MTGEANSPVPDPTILTTEQLLREITNLKDWCRALVNGNAALTEEKFKSVEAQLVLLEKFRTEQKADAADALRAALAAATDQIAAQAQSTSDLKDRVSKVENMKAGATEQRATQTENRTGVYALIGCIGAVLLIVTIAMNLLTGTGT